MKKVISIIVFGLLLSGNAYAAKFSAKVGDIVENEITFGKRDKFPLPPGKFTVGVIKKTKGFEDIILYQIDEKSGTIRWSIYIYATKGVSNNWWNPSKFCKRTNVYFIKKRLGNKRFACWMVNHSRSDITSNSGFWKLVRDYEIANKIMQPDIYVYFRYAYSKGSKLYGVRYFYNPELDGVPKPKNLSWATNEFHMQRVMQYPKHEAFLKKFISVSANLVDRFNQLNKVTGGLTLNPEENFTQASINVEKKEPKKVKKSTDKDKGDIVSQIKGLKELLDAGAITQDEFDKAKKKLLN
jgi:hypothetical protein